MKFRMISFVMIQVLAICLFSSSLLMAADRKQVNIYGFLDGPWEQNRTMRELMRGEIDELLGSEFDIRYPEDDTFIGDWTRDSVRGLFDNLLENPEVDIIICGGLLASMEAGNRKVDRYPKPVFAPFVVNAELQSFPRSGQASGVNNFNYLTFRTNLLRDLEVFRELVPFECITVLISSPVFESYPDLKPKLEKFISERESKSHLIFVGRSAESALSQITDDDEAVILGPQPQLPEREFKLLVDGLIERKLPSFSTFGRSEVEAGILATLAPEFDLQRLARRVALNIQRVLLGEDAGDLPVEFTKGEKLTINMATARAIGVKPSWTILTEADLINEEDESAVRTLTLTQVAREAIEMNLNYRAREFEVLAGEQDVAISRSTLLPRVEIGGQGTIIDSDRAAASLGQQPERSFSGSTSLSQVLFSEPAWANYTIQKNLQESRELDRESLRLDLVYEAATAYMNILRAMTFLRIQKENLTLTIKNLDLARVRVEVGYAGSAEEYRWESERANARKEVIEAEHSLDIARIALNQLLHKPLEVKFSVEEISYDDPSFCTSDPRLEDATDNPWDYKIFRDFLVQQGMKNSPDLKRLDSLIQAKRRELSSTNNAFWAPTVGLEFNLTERIAESGAGSGDLPLPAGFPADLGGADDTNWAVGVNFSLPLFTGASRIADKNKAGNELDKLLLDRQAAAEKIEQHIRNALYNAGTSNASIELSRQAAEAAHKNFELVSDAYTQGVVSIIELLDAQNFFLVSEQVAANAVYDFIIDMLAVERAAGRFWLFRTSAEKEQWFNDLERFFLQAGSPIGQ
jgi:outer membrane protein TolC/ABC-type uncharacterized transport system substrate-binding protein